MLESDGQRRSSVPEGSNDGYTAFISYRRRLQPSAAVAKNLREQLEKRGVKAYFDTEDNEPGVEWLRLIDSVMAAPSLRVGVVIIEQQWVAMLGQEELGREDIVLREVEHLLQRRARAATTDGANAGGETRFVIYPIYVLNPLFDPSGFPDPPPDGSDRVQAVYDGLYELQALPVSAFDHRAAVVAAADHIRDLVHGEGGDGMLGGPRPLAELARDDELRTRLFDHARRLDVGFPDLRVYTILGQQALLNQDFETAAQRLSVAWKRAHADFSSGSPTFRNHVGRLVWMAHAGNMRAVAAMGGHRPRRLSPLEATELWRKTLSPTVRALAATVDLFGDTLDGDSASSVGHVAAISLALVNFVHEDFFKSRHLGFGNSTPAELVELAHATQLLARHVGPELSDRTRTELTFLKRHFLEGLPESDPRDDVRALTTSRFSLPTAQDDDDPPEPASPSAGPPAEPDRRRATNTSDGDDETRQRRYGILLTKVYDGDPGKFRHRESLFRRGVPLEHEPLRRMVARVTVVVSIALIALNAPLIAGSVVAALLVVGLFVSLGWAIATLLRKEDRPFRAVPIETYDRAFEEANRTSQHDALRRLGWDESEEIYAHEHFAIPRRRLIHEVTPVADAVGEHPKLRLAVHTDMQAPPDERYRFSAYEFHHVYAKPRWLGYARSRWDFIKNHPAEPEHLDFEQWRLSDVVGLKVTPTTFVIRITDGQTVVIPLAAKSDDDEAGEEENGEGDGRVDAVDEADPPPEEDEALSDFDAALMPGKVERARMFVNMVRLLSDGGY
jgi:hypothetical protein